MQYILTEKKNSILYITINREDKMNALNMQLIQEIDQAIADLHDDATLIGAILTGAGTKAFAAGADIAEFAHFSQQEGTELSISGHEVFDGIENSSKPVIAVVHGFALGGGCELAMACHMRIAAENAKFGQPEVNLGVVPGYGGTQRLIQLVGKAKAIEMLLTGNPIDAQEAHRLGLANYVLPTDQVLAKAEELLTTIGKKGPIAIENTIALINDYFDKEEDGFVNEINTFGETFATPEFIEGTTAFLEKRKANFTRQ